MRAYVFCKHKSCPQRLQEVRGRYSGGEALAAHTDILESGRRRREHVAEELFITGLVSNTIAA